MKSDVRRWLAEKAEAFLRRVGLRAGQTVLDFGCDKGNYTIPAAQAVGQEGKVYALDKDGEALSDLKSDLQERALDNVTCIEAAEDNGISLQTGIVDVVLLYDVLHRGYFPDREQRRDILTSIHRMLKPAGLLSFYPTHLRKYDMTLSQVLDEAAAAGFRLKERSRRKLVHDGSLVRGYVFGLTRK